MPSVSPAVKVRRCPVCVDAAMGRLASPGGVTVDFCRRCSGVWFDCGEAAAHRGATPHGPAHALLDQRVHVMQCHGCAAAMSRDAEACPSCERENALACPACDTGSDEHMEVVAYGRVRLDACRRCRGVWFDAAELVLLWNSALSTEDGERTPRRDWEALLSGVDPDAADSMPTQAPNDPNPRWHVAADNRPPPDTGSRDAAVGLGVQVGADIVLDVALGFLVSLFD